MNSPGWNQSIWKSIHAIAQPKKSTIVGVLLLFALATAQAQTKIKFDKKSTPPATPLFALEDLRPGMKAPRERFLRAANPRNSELKFWACSMVSRDRANRRSSRD